MASRPALTPHKSIDAASMGADITSQVSILQNVSKVSFGLSWTGSSPLGSLLVQVSNDYKLSQDGSTVLNAGSWSDLDIDAIAISGDSGTGFIDIESTSAYAIRLFYDRTSGTGTLNATITGKP